MAGRNSSISNPHRSSSTIRIRNHSNPGAFGLKQKQFYRAQNGWLTITVQFHIYNFFLVAPPCLSVGEKNVEPNNMLSPSARVGVHSGLFLRGNPRGTSLILQIVRKRSATSHIDFQQCAKCIPDVISKTRSPREVSGITYSRWIVHTSVYIYIRIYLLDVYNSLCEDVNETWVMGTIG